MVALYEWLCGKLYMRSLGVYPDVPLGGRKDKAGGLA
jgi:hypothetical protein